MLQRLEVGLADEGVRVLQALPRSCAERLASDSAAVYTTSVGYHDHGLPFTTGLRARALAEELAKAAPPDTPVGEPVGAGGLTRARLADVVLVCAAPPTDNGEVAVEKTWALAGHVARRVGAARTLFEVSSPRMVDAAGRTWRGRGGLAGEIGFLAPDAGLVVELARRVPSQRVRMVPWGVHPGHAARAPIDAAGTFSLMLLADGSDAAALHSSVQALGQLATLVPGLLVLADAALGHPRRMGTPGLWALVERVPSLKGRVSLIAELESRRDLALTADAVLLAGADGRQRSIVFECMARGTIVFAPADALNEALVDNVSCVHIQRLAHTPAAPMAAAQTVAAVAGDALRAAGLRASALSFVAANRSTSGQVRALLSALHHWGA